MGAKNPELPGGEPKGLGSFVACNQCMCLLREGGAFFPCRKFALCWIHGECGMSGEECGKGTLERACGLEALR